MAWLESKMVAPLVEVMAPKMARTRVDLLGNLKAGELVAVRVDKMV